MNENQIKTKIIILKSIDTILILSLIAAAIYTSFYAEEKAFLIIACLVALVFISALGRFISNKVAVMHVQLEMLIRDKKKEKQRTLLSTRHSTLSSTKKSTGTITNPVKNDE
jgi:hypothetical protein